MPYKAKKPCVHQGCQELTAGRYCEAHAKQEAQRYNRLAATPTQQTLRSDVEKDTGGVPCGEPAV